MEHFEVPHEQELRTYHALETQLHEKKAKLLEIMKRPAYIVPFLQPGRLLRVREALLSELLYDNVQINSREKDFGWGPLIAYERKNEENSGDPRDIRSVYTLSVLLNFAPFTGELRNFAVEAIPARHGEPARPEVREFC